MFHTLSDVQRGEAVPLQQYIDNRDGHLCIGLKSITFAVGWYNIEQGETFSWRSTGEPEETLNIPPGLYGFVQLQDVIEGASPSIKLSMRKVNGLISLTVGAGWEVLLTDGLLCMLGLDDGLGGQWLDKGTYDGDRAVDFASRKVLRVHLEQIGTTGNVVDGAPSSLLASVGVGCHSFGDIHTVRVEHPEFKRLQNGPVSELKAVIRDETGKAIDNQDLPIYMTLEVLPRIARL